MNFKAKISMYVLTLFVSFFAGAQDKKVSPAAKASGTINGTDITINYSSPSVKGRVIWGKLVHYGQVWRAGADEATTFENNKTILIDGQKLPAGKYSFFIIPDKDNATVIFNTEDKQWGAYDYNEKKDQLRVKIKPRAKTDSTEKLTYAINKDNVTLSWEKLDFVIPIK